MDFDDAIAVMAEHEIKHATDEPDDGFVMRQLALSLLSVSAGSQQLLYFAGSKFGKKLSFDAEDRVPVLEDVADLFDRWGYGELTVTDEEGTVIEIDESLFVDDLEPTTDKPVCFFLAGMIAGCLQSGCGEKHVVNEIACQAQDDEICRFKVREA